MLAQQSCHGLFRAQEINTRLRKDGSNNGGNDGDARYIVWERMKLKKLLDRELEYIDLNQIYTIFVLREIDLRTSQSNDNEFFIFHLLAKEDQFSRKQCSNYMWRQWFPMEDECKVEKRKDIEKWALTLAFPMGKWLTGRKYGDCRNLCFSSHKNGNLISIYNGGRFVTGFFNRKYHFQ